MCRIAEEIKAEGRAEGRAEMVRHVMKTKGVSFAEACDYLVLSASERSALEELFRS